MTLPKRKLSETLKLLIPLVKEIPDFENMRIGQFINNLTQGCTRKRRKDNYFDEADIFYIEDEKLLEEVVNYGRTEIKRKRNNQTAVIQDKVVRRRIRN